MPLIPVSIFGLTTSILVGRRKIRSHKQVYTWHMTLLTGVICNWFQGKILKNLLYLEYFYDRDWVSVTTDHKKTSNRKEHLTSDQSQYCTIINQDAITYYHNGSMTISISSHTTFISESLYRASWGQPTQFVYFNIVHQNFGLEWMDPSSMSL